MLIEKFNNKEYLWLLALGVIQIIISFNFLIDLGFFTWLAYLVYCLYKFFGKGKKSILILYLFSLSILLAVSISLASLSIIEAERTVTIVFILMFSFFIYCGIKDTQQTWHKKY